MAATDKQKDGLTPVVTPTSYGGGEGIITSVGAELHAHHDTKRGLSPRHVQLMAIGGSIGTGLWVSCATNQTLANIFCDPIVEDVG